MNASPQIAPVAYAPPDRAASVTSALRGGPWLTARDLEGVFLPALAHEVARRAESARAAGEEARSDRLRGIANELRAVADLPPFTWR